MQRFCQDEVEEAAEESSARLSQNEGKEVAETNPRRTRVAAGSAFLNDGGLYIAFKVAS